MASYHFLNKGDSRMNLNDLIGLQQRIDEYRAKFKHNDLTPHTWHFNGDKAQGWLGATIAGGTLIPAKEISSPGVNIDASVYKYFSMKLKSISQPIRPCELKWYDTSDNLVGSKSLSMPLNEDPSQKATEIFVDADLDETDGWVGTIGKISLSYIDGAIAYIKIDKVDPMRIKSKVDIDSFNGMVDNVQRLAGTPSGAEKNLSALKAVDDKRVNKKQIVHLYNEFNRAYNRAYNGCATCDTNIRVCESKYGFVACKTCDGCNEYSACTCYSTCHTQGTNCTCNATCHGQEKWICKNGDVQCSQIYGCGQAYAAAMCGQVYACNRYTQCACDGVAYIPCPRYNPVAPTVCTSGYAFCAFCHGNAYDPKGCPSFSSQACPQYTAPPQCVGYQNLTCQNSYSTAPKNPTRVTTCAQCHTNSATVTLAQCAQFYNTGCMQTYVMAVQMCPNHVITYGSQSAPLKGSSTRIGLMSVGCGCDGQTCNGYTACVCNSKVYGTPTCACNATCYTHQGCKTCNGCNAYSGCSTCDNTCYQDSCRACHNKNYHCPTDTMNAQGPCGSTYSSGVAAPSCPSYGAGGPACGSVYS